MGIGTPALLAAWQKLKTLPNPRLGQNVAQQAHILHTTDQNRQEELLEA